MKTRFLAGLLVFCMLLVMLPITAAAADLTISTAAAFNALVMNDEDGVYDGNGITVVLKDSERSYQNNKTAQFFIGATNVNITDPVETVKVSNVTFVFEDDDTANNYTSGELQVFAKYIEFTGCTFNGVAVSPWGISNTENAETAVFTNCKWNNLSGRYGVHQNRASSLTVTNCTFNNCERGIHTNSSTVSSITITNNTFTGIGDGYGVLCLAENGDLSAATLNITGNIAENQVMLRQLNTTTTYAQVSAILDTNNNTYGTAYVSGSIVPAAPVYVAAIGEEKYESLADAINAGGNIVLLADVTLTEALTVPAGATVVLDLNGKTVTYNSTTQGEAMITNKGNLTINDTVGTGVINYNYTGAADSNYGKGNYTISNGGTLTVNGGKITIANLRAHAKYPIDNNSTTGDAILVINGGHLYNYNTSAIRQFCNSTTNKNSVTINGGLIEGYCAIWVQNPGKNTVKGSLTITGGEIRSTAKAYVNGTSELKDVSSRVYCTIDGVGGGAWSSDSYVSITGGTLNENVYFAEEAPAEIKISDDAMFNGYTELTEDSVFGGYFTTDPSAYLADGYRISASDISGYAYMVVDEEDAGSIEENVEASTAESNVTVSENIKDEHKGVVESVASQTTVSELGAIANDVAATVTKDEVSSAVEELMEEVAVNEGATVTVHVQTYLDIEPTAYTPATEDSEASLTLDITPMSRLVASTESEADNIVLESNGKPKNAVVIENSEKEVKVTTPVTITIPLPAGFANDEDTLYITHIKDDGSEYVYEGTVSTVAGQPVVTFTNPHGFSIFTISTKDNSVAKIGEIGFTSLQDAVDAVENGGTITVVKTGESATVSRTVTFTVTVAAEENITYSIEAGRNTTVNKITEDSKVKYEFTYSGPSMDDIIIDGLVGIILTDDTTATMMPEKDVLTFGDALDLYQMQIMAQSGSFADVSKSDWFYSDVTALVSKGVVSGYPDGSFKPYGEVTWGEALKLVMKAVGYGDIDPTNGHWASGYMDAALANLLISGEVDLDPAITREEVANLAAQALKLAPVGIEYPFDDAAPEAAVALYAAGIINGSADNGQLLFRAESTITRAEMAAIIWRVYCAR